MRIFLNKWFVRFARNKRLSHALLRDAIARAESGAIDAELGGGLIKQRITRPGRGRSGGYRAVIAIRRGDRAFFVFGFARSDRENLDPDELLD